MRTQILSKSLQRRVVSSGRGEQQAFARVELNPGDVPRWLQAEGGGEKSFDLVVHEISGQQLGRRVISPTVMFAVESNSTGNSIEPIYGSSRATPSTGNSNLAISDVGGRQAW